MPNNQKRINAFIPLDLDSKITQSGESYTNCITKALTLYFSPQDNPTNQDHNEISQDILQEKELRIKELESHKETLTRELENLKNKEPENKGLLQEKELRIQEFKEQIKIKDSQYEKIINGLQDQLKIKDDQIEKRDSDIKNLVAITTSQTYKAIEAPGAKKPWWKLW
jgi:chromosome segregation ATPase